MGMIIADLPNATSIEDDSYVIIEKPGVGEGTYKGTVGDLHRPLTDQITALVDQMSVINTSLQEIETSITSIYSLLSWNEF